MDLLLAVCILVQEVADMLFHLGQDLDIFPKKVWKKSDFCPKSLDFYKMATYHTFLESLGLGQCNKNIFKMVQVYQNEYEGQICLKIMVLRDYFYLGKIIDIVTLYFLVFGKFSDYRYTLELFFKIFLLPV